jgi:hypothetical protein
VRHIDSHIANRLGDFNVIFGTHDNEFALCHSAAVIYKSGIGAIEFIRPNVVVVSDPRV